MDLLDASLKNLYDKLQIDDWLFNDKIIPKKIKRPLEEAIKKIKQDKENEAINNINPTHKIIKYK